MPGGYYTRRTRSCRSCFRSGQDDAGSAHRAHKAGLIQAQAESKMPGWPTDHTLAAYVDGGGICEQAKRQRAGEITALRMGDEDS